MFKMEGTTGDLVSTWFACLGLTRLLAGGVSSCPLDYRHRELEMAPSAST